MREPWIPTAMILIVVLGVWLSIFGPLPSGVAGWVQQYQTLIAASVALLAACIAYRNTSRTLQQNEILEQRRRNRKHAALRAVLPLALAQVLQYAERSARALNNLINQCVGENLPAMSAPEDLAQTLPPDTLTTLAEFIEFSDTIDVSVLEATISWLQIFDSRVRNLVEANRNPAAARIVLRAEIEGRIIDAASIYAGAASIFEYARRRDARLPENLGWEAVTRALRNMGLWEDENPRLHQIVAGRAAASSGPFDRLAI